jgi:Flp pilus assembly protein TadG
MAVFHKFFSRTEGGTSVTMALSIIPLIAASGVAIDFARTSLAERNVQAAVDHAALAAVSKSGDKATRKTYADSIFAASMGEAPATSSLVTSADGAITYSATVEVPNKFFPFLAEKTLVTRRARSKASGASVAGTAATAPVTDAACIHALGLTTSLLEEAVTFNGSPSVNLSGCFIRSNRTAKCNGGSTYSAGTYAAGTVTGCANPNPNQGEVPDVYASIFADNIAAGDYKCGTTSTGLTWTATAAGSGVPTGNAVKTAAKSGYNQIHICGNLTLSGTGLLRAANPDTDLVVVVENGGIIMAADADVSAQRMTFVLANGATNKPPILSYPNGKGKAANLTIKASTGSSNPWNGHAIHINPALSGSAVEMDWKPGASITFDGILYFPKTSLTMSGNASVGPNSCAKIVTGDFILNGNVGLTLTQTSAACADMGVEQHTTPGTPAVAAQAGSSSYLAE